MRMKSIKIPMLLVKTFMLLSNFFNDNNFLVVCKGYDGDYDSYTGLYWDEDKDIDIKDSEYFDFQLWFRIG